MQAQAQDISLLYVEDEDAVRCGVESFLKRRFQTVFLARDGHEGLDIYRERNPDIVITDVKMPGMNGISMAREIMQYNQNTPIIITTAHNEADYLLEALNLGIKQYILKPIEREKLHQAITKCVDTVRERRCSEEYSTQISDAYQTINSIMDFGEQNAATFESAEKVDLYCLDALVNTLLSREYHTNLPGPSVVLIANNAQTENHTEWLWYEMSLTGTLNRYRYVDPPRIEVAKDNSSHTLYYLNMGDPFPEDHVLHLVMAHLADHAVDCQNFVWYRNGGLVICAFNYPRRVSSYDGAVIKGLAVQSLFIDNLSRQWIQTENAFAYTINALARAAEANDEDTGNHILRVGEYCAALAHHMGLSDERVRAIALKSQLHDVGKIHVAPALLRKPTRLTDEEMQQVRLHTIYGAKIIGSSPRLETAYKMALYHHEHWDGSGYPYGLSGTSIPAEARILALADNYDALRNKRSYKPAFDHESACHIILQGDGRTIPGHFDPAVLRAFRTLKNKFAEIYEQSILTELSSFTPVEMMYAPV